MKTRTRAAAITLSLASLSAAAGVWATAASAHVTVAAPGVSAGASDATITFRVPDESDKASTVGLKVQLPTDHPIAGVLVAPVPGWTSTIKQTKLATPIKTDDGDITEIVSEIDWKANAGAGIQPGYFGQFTIVGGKLPDDANSLTFKAIQLYSDGSTVSWIDQPAPGSTAEPEHPAPTLALPAAAASTAPASANPNPTVTATAAASQNNDAASKSSANVAIILGVIGVLLGAAALALALRRGSRASGSTAV
jgi:uncharacterized protein YcnI